MRLTLAELRQDPLYQFGSFGETPVVIYDDDRWLLPVLASAQSDGLLPQPALLVAFDLHHDALPPRNGLGDIPSIRAGGYPKEALFDLVRNHLSALDDDWIKAGMELGLISDAVAYGVHEGQPNVATTHRDHLGHEHRLFIQVGLPGSELEYQGHLSDLARSEGLSGYWDVLGWEHSGRGGRFGFRRGLPKIIVNIDLDCFAMYWRGYHLPWPDEVFEKEFHKVSDYFSTDGLAGVDVFRDFCQRAGMITIAREPNCTGGPEKGATILRRVNRYLFGGELRLPELDTENA